MIEGLTKEEEKLKREIKKYRRKKYFEVSEKEAIEIWNEVRAGARNRFPNYFWGNTNHHIYLAETFIKEFKKENNFYPGDKNFRANKLSTLVQRNKRETIFRLVGYTNPRSKNYDKILDKTPWNVMEKVYNGYWGKEDNRKSAARLFIEDFKEKNKKYPRAEDFSNVNLAGLLHECKRSTFYIFEEAGYIDVKSEYYDSVLDETPWLVVESVPNPYWTLGKKAMAVLWLVKTLKKSPLEITAEDFRENGLGSLMTEKYFNGSPAKALKSTGLKIRDEELRKKPRGFWKDEKNFKKRLQIAIDEIGHYPIYPELEENGFYDIANALSSHGYKLSTYREEYETHGTLI